MNFLIRSVHRRVILDAAQKQTNPRNDILQSRFLSVTRRAAALIVFWLSVKVNLKVNTLLNGRAVSQGRQSHGSPCWCPALHCKAVNVRGIIAHYLSNLEG